MKNSKVIFFKEMKRIFTDRRMLLALFLPGILIFFLYSFMGEFMNSKVFVTEIKDTTYQIAYTENYTTNPDSDSPILLTALDAYIKEKEPTNTFEATKIKVSEVEEYKTKLENSEIDLLITYTDNFETLVYTDPSAKLDNSVCLFYNGKTAVSSSLYTNVNSLVATCYNNYLVNIVNGEYLKPNVSEEEYTLKKVMAFIFPMITVSMLCSSALSICPETIAGEKERGTLTSILLTPIERKEFVFGKVSALVIVAIAGGMTSFMGIILSLPKMFNGLALAIDPGMIIGTLLIIVSMMMFFVSFGVLISTLSNSIKEANSFLGPLSGLFMALALVPSFVGTNIGFSFIPVLNLSNALSAMINGGQGMYLYFIFAILSNILFTGLFIFLTTKLFKKEQVILGH